MAQTRLVRRKKKLSRRKCKECRRGFKPLNVRHDYCSHRCKNRNGARRRYVREQAVRRRQQRVLNQIRRHQ